MDVGSETFVVRKVPAWVVWIFINYYIVTIPVPAVAIAEIVRSNAKVESSEPEARWTAAG